MFRWLTTSVAAVSLLCSALAFAEAGQPAQPGMTSTVMAGSPSDAVAATGVGVAERYWLRHLSGQATLWLYIDNAWRRLDNPSGALQDAVQEAICACPTTLEVIGGYSDKLLSYLVVRSKLDGDGKLKVKLVNMIPASLSGEANQDSEPFLAVDRLKPNNMAGTAFTPNPTPSQTGRAPIYVTRDGGDSWLLNTNVPSNLRTSDITIAGTDKERRLHAGILKIPGGLLMNVLRTDNFFSTALMSVQLSRGQVDQPFVQAATHQNTDRVYVGSNDFAVTDGKTATVDFSLDDGATFTTVRIEPRSTAGQDGPSIRPTIANDGTVYVAYFGWRAFNQSTGLVTSDVVVVRDDNGGSGANPFTDLKDPSDGLSGRKVVSGVTIPWSNAPTLGQERIGSTLSIAVDPNNSKIVYVGWADRVGDGDIYTIHVRRSTDRGVNWSSDLRRIRNATPFALAVAKNGTVGFLYQQFIGGRWVSHLEQTRDGFGTINDTVLATVPGSTPPFQFLPYLGDYNFLLAIGGEFRGIFSTNNMPNLANFPNKVKYQRKVDFATQKLLDGSGNEVAVSIDPFYFSVAAIQ